MSISWKSLSVELLKPERRMLLRDACGVARHGRVLAVLGPSGAGKSTLLQSLAGRLERTRKLHLSGMIEPTFSDGVAPVSFIYQDDAFHSRLTVEETLLFSASLRLPSGAVRARVAEVLLTIGLQDIASSIVGNMKVRGISGGERKRLAIGRELVANTCSPLFADEPTSGLDSFQALRILEALRTAAANRVVVLSVHQPSARLMQCFDDVLLLGAGGRTLYVGCTSELQQSIESQTRVLIGKQPPMSSMAEWMLELASIDQRVEADGACRVTLLAEAWSERYQQQQMEYQQRPQMAAIVHNVSLTVQLRWCVWRAWRQSTASMTMLAMRIFSTLVTGALFGFIFWQLDPGDVKARSGLLQVLCNYFGMTFALRSVRVLQDGEAVVVYRERASRVLRLTPYFLGKVAAELPLTIALPTLLVAVMRPITGLEASLLPLVLVYSLECVAAEAMGLAAGACAPSLDAGLEMAKAVMTIFIVFGGIFFDASSLPWVIRWVQRFSLVHITWNGALAAESRALAEKVGSSPSTAAIKAPRDSSAHLELACISVFLYAIAFIGLAVKAPRFQRILALPQGSSVEFRSETERTQLASA